MQYFNEGLISALMLFRMFVFFMFVYDILVLVVYLLKYPVF